MKVRFALLSVLGLGVGLLWWISQEPYPSMAQEMLQTTPTPTPTQPYYWWEGEVYPAMQPSIVGNFPQVPNGWWTSFAAWDQVKLTDAGGWDAIIPDVPGSELYESYAIVEITLSPFNPSRGMGWEIWIGSDANGDGRPSGTDGTPPIRIRSNGDWPAGTYTVVGRPDRGWAEEGPLSVEATALNGTMTINRIIVRFPLDASAQGPTCDIPDNAYLVLSVVIPANNESGVSLPVEAGKTYILELSGQWNDGASDRSDAAFSTDGGNTWQVVSAPLMGDNGCGTWEGGVSKYKFTARTSGMLIRVNDQPGQFADNTGQMTANLYVVETDTCSQYFDNPGYYVSGTIDPTTSLGSPLPPPGYDLIPGKWYKLEITAGWTEGDGTSYKDFEIGDNGAWIPLDQWASIQGCASGDYYYFQAQREWYVIRVQDKDGIWENNSGGPGYNLYMVEYRPPANPCEGLYTIQNWIESPTIWADQEYGSAPSESSSMRLEAGMYYLLEQQGPPWQDGGVDRYDFEISFDLQTWTDPEDHPLVLCVSYDEVGRKKVFFQAGGSLLYIRAKDWDGDRSNNTGYLGFNLYIVGDNTVPPGNSCSPEFGLAPNPNDPGNPDPTPIEQGSVPANLETGQQIGTQMVPGEWYALDASLDYWQDNGVPRNEADLGQNGQWWLMQTFPGAACAELVDNMYVRVYFRAPEDPLFLRAHDPFGDWTDNSDYVTYRIFPAYHQEPPPPSACWQQYTLEVVESGVIYASLEQGQEIEIVGEGTWAVEEVAPAWSEGDGQLHHALDISPDGGENWYRLEYAPFAECIFATGPGTYRIYFTSQAGQQYRLRVHDMDGDFSNNSGQAGYIVYAATEIEPGPVPPDACEAYFPNPEFVGSGQIPADNPDGVVLNEILPGFYYRIELADGPWYDGSTPSFDAEISNDNGQTWTLMDDQSGWALCAFYTDTAHIRGYIHAQDGQTWRIRVHDPLGDYSDNSGHLTYYVYRVQYQEPVPDVPIIGEGCEAVCYRPTSILNVPAWIEYARCRLIKFLAFCPYHASALESLTDNFWQREPFATFKGIVDTINQIQNEIAGEAWDSELTDPFGGLSPEDMLNFADAQNPYMGAPIQILGEPNYTTQCSSKLAEVIGNLATPMCFLISTLHSTGVASWMQLILDFLSIAVLIVYLWEAWINRLFG